MEEGGNSRQITMGYSQVVAVGEQDSPVVVALDLELLFEVGNC